MASWQLTIENQPYNCGSEYISAGHSLHGAIIIGQEVSCEIPQEAVLYQCGPNVATGCARCGDLDCLLKVPLEMLGVWKTIFPLFATCFKAGKPWHATGRLPKITAQKQEKRARARAKLAGRNAHPEVDNSAQVQKRQRKSSRAKSAFAPGSLHEIGAPCGDLEPDAPIAAALVELRNDDCSDDEDCSVHAFSCWRAAY